jgi:hypothetical protein
MSGMRARSPELDAPQTIFAEDQHEYLPVAAAMVRNPGYACPNNQYNTVVLRFEPTAEERKRLADGADVYVSLLTFGGLLQPIIVSAGKEEVSAMYNVRTT